MRANQGIGVGRVAHYQDLDALFGMLIQSLTLVREEEIKWLDWRDVRGILCDLPEL